MIDLTPLGLWEPLNGLGEHWVLEHVKNHLHMLAGLGFWNTYRSVPRDAWQTLAWAIHKWYPPMPMQLGSITGIRMVGAEMQLRRACDFEVVRAGYVDVAENTPQIERHARWVYGKHPTDGMIRAYVDNDEMYLLMEGDDVAGMVAIVMRQDEDYQEIPWAERLANDEVATLHILAIRPAFRGRRLGSTMLEAAARLARQSGRRAMRLDVLESNLPAQRMYERAGFSYRGKRSQYAENTGWTDFLYYEMALE